MRTRTRTLVVTALLALLVAVAGCSSPGGSLDVSNAPDAGSIQDNVTRTMQSVETATFTMDMTVTTPDQEVSMNADGAMDRPNERLRMDMEVSAGQSVQSTQYVLGDTAYVRINEQWQTQNLSDQRIWQDGNNQLAVQQELLRNASLEVTGTDTVGGNPVWVVSLRPDPADLRALVSQRAGTGGIGENVTFDNVTVTQYVDAESYHVRQVDVAMDLTAEGQEGSIDMTMTFEAFDDPVTIELPEGAPA